MIEWRPLAGAVVLLSLAGLFWPGGASACAALPPDVIQDMKDNADYLVVIDV